MVRLAGESLKEVCQPWHQAVEIAAVESRAHAGQRRPRWRLRQAARTGPVDVADHHALPEIRRDRGDVAVGADQDRRVALPTLVIELDQIRDIRGEAGAVDVIHDQRDRPQALAQAERPLRGEVLAADHLLEAEHRAADDPREHRLAAVGAAVEDRVHRVGER
jgi:hypothetical protein